MADAPDQPGGTAKFVRDIVSDPRSVPDVMLVYGYLGASSEAEHERLYLNADLADYVEIPSSAILHRVTAPPEQDPHGGVTLWVKKDAKLVYKMAPGAEALARYFAGQIQEGVAAASAPQPPPMVTPGFGPQGPVALGNSPFIRSCIQCNSFHWNCTLVEAPPVPVALGNSPFIRSCVRCNSFHWNCTMQVPTPEGPLALGNSRFIRSCIDTNCIRTHLICTM